eukprot:TRINITY_DN14402_c0_g3_i1.p1 TRINITY_DN14402_c0_g3~~TRINITY_DN14402_c0_g3_i1.p1  ORF type:complete len:338 (+),score=62.88 TRINITY_DN14402_c0_g3_i1:50-1015(+)
MTDVLTPEEWQRVRGTYSNVMGDKHNITSVFELQSVCAQLGLNEGLEELEKFLEENQHEVNFLLLLEYVSDVKRAFFKPEPRDIETVRAFMAVGGDSGGSGTIDSGTLKDMCYGFDVMLDHRSMDGDTISFNDFKTMFSEDGSREPERLKLGYDYALLLEQERKKQSLFPKMEKRRTRVARGSISHRGSMLRSSVLRGRSFTDIPVPPDRQPSSLSNNFKPQPPDDGTLDVNDNTDSEPQSTKKVKKRKPPKKTASKQDTLGPQTKPCGRTGVYVDSTSQSDSSWLPSLSKGAKIKQTSQVSPILARIDARVDASYKNHRF